MSGGMFSSPRARRRLLWAGALLAAAAAGALLLVLLPSQSGGIKSTRTGTVQLVPHLRQVPVTARERAQIDALFDHFVPAAMARRDPVAARADVTPNLRSQAPLADWRRGSIPVPPFQPAGTSFHGWRTVYSYPKEMNVELTLEPKLAGQEVTSFSVNLRLVRGKWLVDGMYELGTHGGGVAPPTRTTTTPTATAASRPSPVDVGLKGRLGFVWILIPLAFLALIVLVPVFILSRDWLADRRVRRRYRSELGSELPPLPSSRARDTERDRTPTGRG